VSGLVVERFRGAALTPYLAALASLRIEVFHEFPYLYEGSLENEQRYLASFAESADSVVVIARDGEQVVGASTASPLLAHGDGKTNAALFRAAGIDPERVFYFGESVLCASQRGRGVGHVFFDQREAAAREQGYTLCAFCAVERPRDHALRPADYVPHDAFWQRRGYTRRPDLTASFSWLDRGQAQKSDKPMVFWLKELGS
jgi:GNAT superfamily N-acetyltransferase